MRDRLHTLAAVLAAVVLLAALAWAYTQLAPSDCPNGQHHDAYGFSCEQSVR